jgi:hypothetical protein
MPLGLARDSMLNLAELASKADDEISLEEDSRSEDANGTSYKKLASSEDNCEEHQNRRKNETDNDASMVEAVKAPMHSKITSDEMEGTENVSSSSVRSNSSLTETKTQKSKLRLNTHQYAGFQADYHDFENYTYNFPGDDVMSKDGSNYKNKDDKPWWQCFFPWISSENDHAWKEEFSETEDPTQNEEEGLAIKTVDSDDEISMISGGSDNVLGERLSPRDRQAVLARSRLAQPDVTKDHGAEDDSFVDETSSRKKSILKCSSRTRDNRNLSTRSNASNGSNSSSAQQKQRRSLFPAYEPKSNIKKNLSTSFSPMAGVVTIKSSKNMDSQEKARIWWQKHDYDAFRRTGRMISKVMLQGGSEVWLATNQSWQLPNQGRAATLRRAMANVNNEDASNKWWHRFGHSRRGLEHIASIDEGRQRQANVKTSIRAILTEQRRQKTFHREDPEKLRMCSIQNTSWAKDLALASGASDADAVKKNFDDENRKSREFYLLKFSRAGKLNSASGTRSGTKQVVPAFMKPMISMQLRPNRLDANTTSRLKFKKKEEVKASNNHKRVDLNSPAIIASESGQVAFKPADRVHIHDPAANVPGIESLAHKGEFGLLLIVRYVSVFGSFLRNYNSSNNFIANNFLLFSCWVCKW